MFRGRKIKWKVATEDIERVYATPIGVHNYISSIIQLSTNATDSELLIIDNIINIFDVYERYYDDSDSLELLSRLKKYLLSNHGFAYVEAMDAIYKPYVKFYQKYIKDNRHRFPLNFIQPKPRPAKIDSEN